MARSAFYILLLIAACNRSGMTEYDGMYVVTDGARYSIAASGKINASEGQEYAVKYRWDGASDAATLKANAGHLAKFFGPAARRRARSSSWSWPRSPEPRPRSTSNTNSREAIGKR